MYFINVHYKYMKYSYGDALNYIIYILCINIHFMVQLYDGKYKRGKDNSNPKENEGNTVENVNIS